MSLEPARTTKVNLHRVSLRNCHISLRTAFQSLTQSNRLQAFHVHTVLWNSSGNTYTVRLASLCWCCKEFSRLSSCRFSVVSRIWDLTRTNHPRTAKKSSTDTIRVVLLASCRWLQHSTQYNMVLIFLLHTARESWCHSASGANSTVCCKCHTSYEGRSLVARKDTWCPWRRPFCAYKSASAIPRGQQVDQAPSAGIRPYVVCTAVTCCRLRYALSRALCIHCQINNARRRATRT